MQSLGKQNLRQSKAEVANRRMLFEKFNVASENILPPQRKFLRPNLTQLWKYNSGWARHATSSTTSTKLTYEIMSSKSAPKSYAIYSVFWQVLPSITKFYEKHVILLSTRGDPSNGTKS
jgi:hypothetical protein